jgi:hypothetical protein
MQLDVGIHLDIEDMIYYAFYKKIVNLRCLRLSAKVSQPVSKYNASKLANFVSPVTILAASNCIFFYFFRIIFKTPIPQIACMFQKQSYKSYINIRQAFFGKCKF